MINKKGTFETSQSIFWSARILYTVLFIIFVTAPIGCYSLNKTESLKLLKQDKIDITSFELKNCIEKEGLDKNNLANCFKNNNAGVEIESDQSSFKLNEENYNPEICISKTVYCPNEEAYLKINDEIMRIRIKMVIHNG